MKKLFVTVMVSVFCFASANAFASTTDTADVAPAVQADAVKDADGTKASDCNCEKVDDKKNCDCAKAGGDAAKTDGKV
ncbi:MAG: hypothetical protein IIY06_09655 [Proteobacteria bacterium]|jgi:hypothetical protein|nr:hypothetical protein [Pseudomonadota bacterium]